MAQPAQILSSSLTAGLPARHADVLRVIGFLQLQYGDPSEAVAVFDVLRAIFPSEQKIALSLALAWLHAGEPQMALDVLDETPTDHLSEHVHIAGFRPEVLDPCRHLLRGQALASLGRLAEAARSMRLFIRQRRLLESQVAS